VRATWSWQSTKSSATTDVIGGRAEWRQSNGDKHRETPDKQSSDGDDNRRRSKSRGRGVTTTNRQQKKVASYVLLILIITNC